MMYKKDYDLFRVIEDKLDNTKSTIIARSVLADAQTLAESILAEMGVRRRMQRRADEGAVKDVSIAYNDFKEAMRRLESASDKGGMKQALRDVAESANTILSVI